jgi:hypothetical protein
VALPSERAGVCGKQEVRSAQARGQASKLVKIFANMFFEKIFIVLEGVGGLAEQVPSKSEYK